MSELKFGKRIREVRKNAGCTQKVFCELLNIPQSTLSAYETDRMQPTVVSLVNIAETFNVSLDWLCGIEQTKPDGQDKIAAAPDSTDSELYDYDDLEAVLDDAEKCLEEFAAIRQTEKFLRKLTAKRAVQRQREKAHEQGGDCDNG